MIPIDWKRVTRALDFFQEQGFDYIETPWVVSREAATATFPATEEEPEPLGLTSGDVPVGSAEQGFLDLMLEGLLKPGYYCSAGPCFRPQDAHKPDHQEQFFKVELLYLHGGAIRGPFLLNAARDFFISELAREADYSKLLPRPVVVDTELGQDLELHDLEIGSYGRRTYEGFTWDYGTGLAEPRFTVALGRAKM